MLRLSQPPIPVTSLNGKTPPTVPGGPSPSRPTEADLGFARENDMKVSDHTGGLEKRVSDFIIAVPTTFD